MYALLLSRSTATFCAVLALSTIAPLVSKPLYAEGFTV